MEGMLFTVSSSSVRTGVLVSEETETQGALNETLPAK